MSKIYSTIISIGLGFLVTVVILVAAGLYPYDFFSSLLRGLTGYDLITGTFNIRYAGQLVVELVPLIFAALSVGFAFKTGLFNIGAEGQILMGSITTIMLGLNLDLPPVIFPIVLIAASALVGALWGAIPGILKAWRGIHEVVICIMLNYIALNIHNLFIRGTEGYANNATPMINENAFLNSEFLTNITRGSNLNYGFIFAAIALVVYYIVINKTTLGYRLKVIGFNKDAAEYSGINVKKGMVQSMAISGAFAGIAGAILILGVVHKGRLLGGFENYGFDGLSVALVGVSSAFGMLLAGILFATLNVSEGIMQIRNIPGEVSVFVSGAIVYFISLSFVTDEKLEHRRIKKEQKKQQKMEALNKEAS